MLLETRNFEGKCNILVWGVSNKNNTEKILRYYTVDI